jgi:hypothetical protein
MTQITQIHTEKNTCVDLRDLRETQFGASKRSAITSDLTYRFEASSIQHPESGCVNGAISFRAN